jgi:predicted amidohydrolase
MEAIDLIRDQLRAYNGLPPSKGGAGVVDEARRCDVTRAIENGVSVIRADVAGRAGGLMSYGSSAIVNRNGVLLASASQLESVLIVGDIDVRPG